MTFQNPPSGQRWNGHSFAVLGDSFSTGYGCVDWRNNWAERLATFLRGDPPNGSTGPAFFNHARNGAIVADHLVGGRWYQDWGRLVMDHISIYDPSLIIIALGANEYGSFNPALSAQYYSEKMNLLVNDLRVRVPEGNLLFVHTPGFHSHKWQLWQEYWWVLQDLQRNTQNSSCLDLSAVLPWGDRTWTATNFHHSDTVHLNDQGHAAVAATMNTHLRAL